MRKINSLILPFSLSVLAVAVVIIASTIYNASLYSIKWGLSKIGISTLAVITFSITFFISWIGIKFLYRVKYTPSLSAIIGIIWGSIAFFLIASVTALSFTPSPREFWRVFEFAFINGFFLGGFFGPLLGSILAYWLAKQYYE